ncbi:MAG: hypothetical protein ACXADC_07515 [Candidatus Thorarchaeota archaeon]|jgi:hypothetical protein
MSKRTKLERDEIIKRAKAEFDGRFGLAATDPDTNCCIEFVSDLGYVTIEVIEHDDENEVILRTREWEYQVQQFIRSL